MHHYDDEAMPAIHREKSIDEYCNSSNTTVASSNKANVWSGYAKNGLQLSPSNAAERSKRVSEGSSNSNCSSSSDNFEGNNTNASPNSKRVFNNTPRGLKSDCLYPSDIVSPSVTINNPSQMQFNEAERKVNDSIVGKKVLNDVKMEMDNLAHDHQERNTYEQKPIQENLDFPSCNFQATGIPQFQSRPFQN